MGGMRRTWTAIFKRVIYLAILITSALRNSVEIQRLIAGKFVSLHVFHAPLSAVPVTDRDSLLKDAWASGAL